MTLGTKHDMLAWQVSLFAQPFESIEVVDWSQARAGSPRARQRATGGSKPATARRQQARPDGQYL